METVEFGSKSHPLKDSIFHEDIGVSLREGASIVVVNFFLFFFFLFSTSWQPPVVGLLLPLFFYVDTASSGFTFWTKWIEEFCDCFTSQDWSTYIPGYFSLFRYNNYMYVKHSEIWKLQQEDLNNNSQCPEHQQVKLVELFLSWAVNHEEIWSIPSWDVTSWIFACWMYGYAPKFE